MKKSELMKLIENLQDGEDVNGVLKDTDIVSTGLTLDKFKSKVKDDKEFKSYIDSLNDSHHSKAIKTMKEKGSWEIEFGDVLKTKYPNLITDPKDKQLFEMEQKIARMEKDATRKELLKDALKYAGEKQLPSDFIDRFLGDDLDTTKSNLDSFATVWSKQLENAIESKFKDNSYTPPGGAGGGSSESLGSRLAQQSKKGVVQKNNYFGGNE